ncbi:MAG: lysine-sensitive aspartokinase 3 [Acidobacteria bacterium]|nr:lysine-sensitive aspartokinase 3 [Acidobacteriota bacterium]MBV9481342.1 lysine-sensitive aspartokinase 3 [Acidobacteriota bacterium]
MLVMKFGGTSMEDAQAIDRVASIVSSRLRQKPAVVVSAMARVTDQLLATARAAGAGDADEALKISRELRERHYHTAGELLGTGRFTEFHNQLESDFDALDELLRGIAAVGEVSPRTADLVAAKGELLSSKIATAAFSARGLQATLVDARDCIITDDTYTRAIPFFEDTNENLRSKVWPLVEDGRVPVLGGFIGSTRAGTTTTIGRGGSDFSAAILGAGLDAERIEIWTDVDGMMTTDPNLCPDAHRIKVLSFDEAAELAYFGAKVLHPATLLPAVQKNIPVYILNSRNPSCEGTRVTAQAPRCRNLFKAIAAKKRITIIDVAATRMLMAHGYLKSIFEAFDRHRVPVDVVSTSEVSVSLTVDSNSAIPALAADLAKLADVKYEGRKAIVCLIGESLRETAGVAARVFSVIPDVSIRMISQGASEINLTFVIDEDAVPDVIRRLHAAFFSDLDREVFD